MFSFWFTSGAEEGRNERIWQEVLPRERGVGDAIGLAEEQDEGGIVPPLGVPLLLRPSALLPSQKRCGLDFEG